MRMFKDRQEKIMKLLRSQAGFTLTEIMVVIAISGFIMAAATVGFIAFFTKFADLNKTIELQRDAFNCLQTIKNGIPIGSGMDLKFSGVATADSVVFVGVNQASNHIILYPPITDVTHSADRVEIYLLGGYVWARYIEGTLNPPAKAIFPAQTRTNKTFVTQLLFSKANTGDAVTKVINVQLVAQVQVRPNQYKSVSYNTQMALAMK
jgi:prepilin-type N-terminal cleavage/methylation domain-containing protein